ncbi:MAG: radical SAM protein [Myxococcota bacterium]|nr:radical SAM protein [Myxococcota bacterium]
MQQEMLEREEIANRKKHWVRAVTACSSRCIFCLDMDTPRNVFLEVDDVKAELARGREELDADKVIISGGEATLHPKFPEMITYARSIGYERVQTVTNGWKFADKDFYRRCMKAGLGEITFSLHGHTAQLHDRLTRHPGSFKRLLKGMIRAVRDPYGPIVNVDVVINKQNVPYLDKIIALCSSLGVYEFDLLHVIPQSEAFRQRDQLFYDVLEHKEVLHKVFRLNQHPRFVIWTNRFPISYLEGLEDLIQDPHKMLDEVNGRRYQVRRYIDTGNTLDCRQPERCKHCFIESFCTTMERTIETQNQNKLDVWYGSVDKGIPFGASRRGLTVQDASQIPDGIPLEIRSDAAFPLCKPEQDIRWIAKTAAQLSSWLENLPANQSMEIELNRETAAWMLQNKVLIQNKSEQLTIHQPSYEKMKQAVENDVENPRSFFDSLDQPIRSSGLPICLLGPAKWTKKNTRLYEHMFKEGRLQSDRLAKNHIEEHYFGKSERCRDCVYTTRCDGLHINMIRAQGLALLNPQSEQTQPLPPQKIRILNGAKPQVAAPSLPGFAPPKEPPRDPLAILAEEREKQKEERRALRMAKRDQ